MSHKHRPVTKTLAPVMNVMHDMHPDSCSMKMVFNWDTSGMCIVFEFWRVNGVLSLILSIVAIFLLATIYEKVRQLIIAFDKRLYAERYEDRSLQKHLLRSLLYGVQIAFSFFLMLIFMTYNVFFMVAVIAGAVTGHFLFHKDAYSIDRSMACH